MITFEGDSQPETRLREGTPRRPGDVPTVEWSWPPHDHASETMFLGKFEVPLDDRNRVVLPASFRSGLPTDPLEASFVLYPARRGRVLRLYPLKPGEGLAEVLEHENLGSKAEDGSVAFEEATVHFMGSLCQVQMDKKHRVQIPEPAKAIAGIQRKAVLLGLSKLIEIWSPEMWERTMRAPQTRPCEATAEASTPEPPAT